MYSAPEMGLGRLASASRLRAAVILVILVTAEFDCSHAQGLAQASGPVTEVTAVVGSTALLPCDILPPLANDSVILVIWFKNEVTPIYSYDIRGKHSELASHWRDKELLQQRGYFRTITEPATLALDDIHEQDEGDYRCRVDFRRSPTRNYKVRLNVIVPPQTPTIIDERGRELPSVAGPYTEGSFMKLSCVVRGGRPPPVVSWWRDERLLPSRDVPSPFPAVQKAQVAVGPLARHDLHAAFTCQARSGNDLAPPLHAQVTLEMHLRPLSAMITSSRGPLAAGRRAEVECASHGSRPAAKISWWLDNQALAGSVDKILDEGNVTLSTVRLSPTPADNGRVLTCRAQNPALPAGVEEDTWRLEVHYAPALRLQLGTSLNPDDIEEGDDVYFECKVHANPTVYKVIWKHDGQEVHHNSKAGVLLINHDLALQGVRREQAGNYSCSASNVEGDGESNVVPLRVMYAPICREDQRRVFAVGRLEAAHVTCHVDAFPPPDAFRWSFNHSALGADAPLGLSSSGAGGAGPHATGETLAYAPASELDYGTLLCAASNAAGQQREPCVFHIVPAGRPEPPVNCSLANASAGALQVECEEGFDGGLPQRFLLEVFDLQSGLLAANVSSASPRFLATGLRAGRALRAMAYAVNPKGRSEPFALEGFTLQGAERRTGPPATLQLTPLLATLLGAVAALLLMATAVAAAATALRRRAARRRQARRDAAGGDGPQRPTQLALKEKALAQPLALDDVPDPDERNPDLIPCAKDGAPEYCQLADTPASSAAGSAVGVGVGCRLLATPTYAAPPRVPSPRSPAPSLSPAPSPSPSSASQQLCNGMMQPYGPYRTLPRPMQPMHPMQQMAAMQQMQQMQPMPQMQNIQPMQQMHYPPHRYLPQPRTPQGEEVQYAELALSRCAPTPPLVGPPRSPTEPTVYAQISHTLRARAAYPPPHGYYPPMPVAAGTPPPPPVRCTPSPRSPFPPPPPPAAAHSPSPAPSTHLQPTGTREVVTVRTPLMMPEYASTQESCV